MASTPAFPPAWPSGTVASASSLVSPRWISGQRTRRFVAAFYPDDTEIIIEAPQFISATWHFKNHNQRARDSVANDVGGVKRESHLLAEGLRRKGFAVTEVKPHGMKWPDPYFRRVTGWDQRTSQHARDAARLVFMT